MKIYTCEGCGKKFKSKYFRDNCDKCIDIANNGNCPKCKSKNLEELIGFNRGGKQGEGIRCKDCNWEYVF